MSSLVPLLSLLGAPKGEPAVLIGLPRIGNVTPLLDHYSRRIRKLRRFSGSDIAMSTWTFVRQLLVRKPLLPNIQRIETLSFQPEDVGIALILVSPSLRVMEISPWFPVHSQRGTTQDEFRYTILNFLETTRCESPHVTTLIFEEYCDLPTVSATESFEIMARFQHLRNLELPSKSPVGQAGFRTLATFPCLLHLTCSPGKFSIDGSQSAFRLGPNAFSGLQELRLISLDGLEDAAGIILAFHPKAPRSIALDQSHGIDSGWNSIDPHTPFRDIPLMDHPLLHLSLGNLKAGKGHVHIKAGALLDRLFPDLDFSDASFIPTEEADSRWPYAEWRRVQQVLLAIQNGRKSRL
ncbi:hypothetical protein BD309DRAFT_962508 [Dichomitus squalens]|uniref:Uncharacterized protein n=1 Tax=Dichomitus squalens TaxID=114155 RepID=A0A4Q9PI59_9APHY|nr:hypothetical protein BD309DRAFT_962508 [Dichomitus squalens]TBU52896.1 hypothetical protein BD310DRAFT_188756 [Dichomitus squalens]